MRIYEVKIEIMTVTNSWCTRIEWREAKLVFTQTVAQYCDKKVLIEFPFLLSDLSTITFAE